MSAIAETEQPGWKKALGAVGLALAGGVFGAALAAFTEGRFPDWADEANFFLGVTLIAMAVVTGVIMMVRPGIAPRACGLLQVVVLVLAGAMLLLPVLAPAEWPPAWAFGGVIGLLIVQSGFNLALWRRADEMMRRVIAETSALSFWVLQAGLLIYATAERLGFVETISGWGLLAILMAVYLLSSVVAAWRRGLT